jgi:hypothetical protein
LTKPKGHGVKRIWSGSSLHDTTHFKNLLDQAGIGCMIKNRELGGALGDLPVLDCGPELWVLRDEDEPRAAALLRETVVNLERSAPPWRCARCGEVNEAQFAACFNCGNADGAAAD